LFLWAHRGASALAPENTMAAFSLAEAIGADGIELDVHLTADGIPVVLHDETVDRTTDGHGPVSGYSLDALRLLDAGSWFHADFSGERLPTLEEVLFWIEGRLRLNIEIKTAAAGQAVLDLLAHYPQVRPLISSFDHGLLSDLRRQAPSVSLGFLSDSRFWRRALQSAVASAAESFHPAQRHTSRPLIRACHQAGLQVYPWTVDAPRRQSSLLRMGVDGFFSNCP
jgi:glycerophosphoryl diester phosphodiesterase